LTNLSIDQLNQSLANWESNFLYSLSPAGTMHRAPTSQS